MWFREYDDRPVDGYLREERVDQGRQVNGCEMRERAGWGEAHEALHEINRPREPGLVSVLLGSLLGFKLKKK